MSTPATDPRSLVKRHYQLPRLVLHQVLSKRRMGADAQLEAYLLQRAQEALAETAVKYQPEQRPFRMTATAAIRVRLNSILDNWYQEGRDPELDGKTGHPIEEFLKIGQLATEGTDLVNAARLYHANSATYQAMTRLSHPLRQLAAAHCLHRLSAKELARQRNLTDRQLEWALGVAFNKIKELVCTSGANTPPDAFFGFSVR